MTNKIREFSRPLRGLDDLPGDPSTKVLGYFHLVRCADNNYQTFRAKSHQLSFEEAKTVFLDDEALLIPDEEHSTEEERFVIMGFSAQLRILVVCPCYRQSDEVIQNH